ncbi:ATP-dependent DNA helicase [Trichonephila clavata]|uniref:ATP-dependent DNA helicase n=1 Tax=Trichonephila clavata TaxID=2740835 RepID=A0A8X6K6A6_TRICU|nr:ATP-dependent DNA helicase [Trichonephila clavata]
MIHGLCGSLSNNSLYMSDGKCTKRYPRDLLAKTITENDAHWDISFADASDTAQPQQIRTLFSIILTTYFPANPKDLWGKYKDYMSEDILHRMRRINANPNIQFSSNIYSEALILIEDVCLTIPNKSLTELGIIAPNRYSNDIFDPDMQQETPFDVNELQTFVLILCRNWY